MYFAALLGHQHIVFDTNADIPPAFGHALAARRNINARLHRQRHTRLQHTPHIADLVVTDIMHVHSQPMASAMHEEATVGAVLDQRAELPFEQTEFYQSLGDLAHRCVMRIIPVIARFGGSNGGVLRLQYHFVYRALLRTVTTVDRKGTGDV